MSHNTTEIIEKLKSLTLLEAAELVSEIEETFGVDASAAAGGAIMMAPMAGENGATTEAAEEKTSFEVIIEAVPDDKRVAVLKVIRALTSLGLREAKELTSGLPKTLNESASKEDADEAKQKLEAAGATVKIA
uniref:ribosomal protein L12 n=1 Tax=Tetraselmis marina TaxID=41888 RepID=UPI0021AD48AB|nr:ribosomal protein L12 [Tetraselmis marina]UUA64526.1 ribosomal protein L12 [Tetraselmis marina]